MSDSFNEQAVIDQLYTSHLFQGMKRTDVQSILAQMHRKHWPRHAQVMPATMTKTNFYILLTGRVRVEAEHPESGRAITLFLLGPGEGHNLITLLDGKPHQVIAETLDEVQALCAPITSWQTWMRTYPALHQAAMRCAGMRLRELADLVEDLALHDTSARLAHLLLRHLDDNENTDHRLHGLVHEDIARLIGSVRVVVNRLLNRFKHEGIIHTEAGNIRLADLERLQEKAERRLHRG
ncbi:Crp/Fnr family transcriptional regulator [Halothiobacillus sp.]|jgi:CRP-like cAMP-binding protein|uniref:Crp/Fnr family transcriptional regulator n=1 Tax=Halothiobacillus sp. TaxID=1891311 RepID=UPI0019982525|nr:Crp/Fnr family transcriptional regulator [Betaproteobacteria bacterium]MDY0146551.1 Crp/Fnr family transcriptional regulator [Halothiobacillus sp.]